MIHSCECRQFADLNDSLVTDSLPLFRMVSSRVHFGDAASTFSASIDLLWTIH